MYRYPNNFGYFKTEFHLTIYLHAMLVEAEDGMGSSATNSRLHTAVTSCPGLELDQQPPMLKAEIQNQYLLYVLLLELSLSLTSLKCFWLEAA